MAKDHISVTDDTSIDDAVKIMEEKRLLNLPIKQIAGGLFDHATTIRCGPASGSESISNPISPRKVCLCEEH